MNVKQSKRQNINEFTDWIKDWTQDEQVQASQIEAFTANLDYIEELVNNTPSKDSLIVQLQGLLTDVATDSHRA